MKEQKHGRSRAGRGAALMVVAAFGLLAGMGSTCSNKDDNGQPAPKVEITNPDNLEIDPAIGGLINDYYQAVNKKDPGAACGLREKCSDTDRDSMVNHYGIELTKITALWLMGDQAALETVGVETHGDGAKTGWKSYLLVASEGAGWKIREIADGPAKEPPPAEAAEPEEVMADYFRALAEKDAETFCELRVDCADRFKHSLMRHTGMELARCEIKSRDAGRAVVYTESVESFADGSRAEWKQDWWLELVKGDWKIARTGNVELTEVGAEGETAEEGPEAVIKALYRAFDDNDVAAACALRTECSAINKESIRNHKPINLIKSQLTSSGGDKATVHTVSIEIDEKGSRWRWEQDWYLLKKKGKWLVEETDPETATFTKEASQ